MYKLLPKNEDFTKILIFISCVTMCVAFVSNSLLNIFFMIFGIFSLFCVQGQKYKVSTGIFFVLGMLFISGVMSNILNFSQLGDKSKSFRALRFYFFSPFISLAFYRVFEFMKLNQDYRPKWLNLIFVFTSVASLSGLIGLLTGFNILRLKPINHPTRNAGMYGMYMTYAYGISLYLTLNLGLLVHFKKFRNYFDNKILVFSFFINFIGLYFSYTRGALIGFLISIPFILFKNIKSIFLSFFVVLIALSFFIFFSKSGRELFLSRERIESNLQRVSFYKGAMYGFLESPVYGLGVKNIESNMSRIKDKHNLRDRRSGHSHNIYLEILANQGVFGAFSFLLFLLFTLKMFYRSEGSESLIGISFMVNFIVSGLFQNTFGDSENLQFIMIVWSAFVAWFLFSKHSCSKNLL